MHVLTVFHFFLNFFMFSNFKGAFTKADEKWKLDRKLFLHEYEIIIHRCRLDKFQNNLNSIVVWSVIWAFYRPNLGPLQTLIFWQENTPPKHKVLVQSNVTGTGSHIIWPFGNNKIHCSVSGLGPYVQNIKLKKTLYKTQTYTYSQ
jgi:hypothetical protein